MFYADTQMDITKLILASCNFANEPKESGWSDLNH
jgi:hypothetical protein